MTANEFRYETRPNCDSNGDFVGRKCQPNGE